MHVGDMLGLFYGDVMGAKVKAAIAIQTKSLVV